METLTPLQKGLSRYMTQTQLDALASVTVGIAGCGGLGSNCAAMLARSGIRNFVLADFDVIEPSNLNRQFFFAEQVGMKKVLACKENLYSIDSSLSVAVRDLTLTEETVRALFAECQIVVEALDSIDGKKMMAQMFLSDERFFVSASGMAGWGEPYMRRRAVRDDAVIVGDFTTDIAQLPPLAPKVTMAAAMQADAVLSYILGDCKTQE
ncbi:MAG: sulfur carrier protein ThiS adenylyltransferase ThiF [Desulfovibrionales bacterium]|nr:sulfur carrier protein ThiS adenylyltransferase ThiF [Desulfovibrionales bacterium]